ncbi:hypothetical protein F383_16778 [Gossypium arboreum]|uniref:Uncharacterized protein n=1 Tax=Gossypium arboreum TaxID=29729 RepID=A0A0B0NI81_GOSAR|nr:hypothetical protein F383_16778 [Gossypium arboreum]
MDTVVCHARVRKSKPCWFPTWVHFLCFRPISRSFTLLCSPKYKT